MIEEGGGREWIKERERKRRIIENETKLET